MALTVNTNVGALKAVGQLNKTQSSLGNTLGRISSGLRVNKAADDAAGLAVATNLNTIARSGKQAMRNANDGISIIATAEGAAKEVTNILDRMRELAVQSSSDTLADDERAYLDSEFDELSAEIQRISASTEFNGVQLADGTTTQLEVQVGTQNATTSRLTISLGDLTATTLGVDTTAIDLSSASGARSAIDAIDDAIDDVNSYRAGYGAVENRINSSLRNMETYVENLSAAQSQIMDADFAHETSEMTKFQIMQQAGVAALAQARNMNSSVSQLLG